MTVQPQNAAWRRWHIDWLDGIAATNTAARERGERPPVSLRGCAVAPRLARMADNHTGGIRSVVQMKALSQDLGADVRVVSAGLKELQKAGCLTCTRSRDGFAVLLLDGRSSAATPPLRNALDAFLKHASAPSERLVRQFYKCARGSSRTASDAVSYMSTPSTPSSHHYGATSSANDDELRFDEEELAA